MNINIKINGIPFKINELIDITEFPDHLGKEYCLEKLNEMINGIS